MMRDHELCIAVLFCCLVAAPCNAADSWFNWRGPNYNGSTDAMDLPAQWSTNSGLSWEADLPGTGASTPIVSNGRVYITAETPAEERKLVGLCIDGQEGKILWVREFGKGSKVRRSNMACPSPVTDGKRVVFLFGSGDLAATDPEGNVLWSRNIVKDYGAINIRFGYCSSPLLFRGKLYVQVIQMDSEMPEPQSGQLSRASYLLCFDPTSGETIWKHTRASDARKESQEAYTSPVLYDGPQGPEVILCGADSVTGHDPETGDELWRWKGYNSSGGSRMRIIQSPVVMGDLLGITAPRYGNTYAIKAGRHIPENEDRVVWMYEPSGSDSPTPLFYDGILYLCGGARKEITAINGKTGEAIWSSKVPATSALRSSATGSDGKIYWMSEKGRVFVMEAGDQFKLLADITMGGTGCRAAIAATDGRLFVRTSDKLYCVDGRKGE